MSLEEIKARRAEFQKERAEKLAAAAAGQAEAQALRDEQDDLAFAKAQDELGIEDVDRVETRLGALIVKRPTRGHFTWFQEEGAKGKALQVATLEQFVEPLIVYPDANKVQEIWKIQPHALSDAADAASRLAGVNYEKRKPK